MFGGVCIDMSKMDAITDYHLEDFDVKVQPGVTREGLNHHVRNDGKRNIRLIILFNVVFNWMNRGIMVISAYTNHYRADISS